MLGHSAKLVRGDEEAAHVAKTFATANGVQRKMDEMGFGRYQLVVLLCCGGIMFSEGAEVLIMGSITTMLAKQWSLDAFMRGSMVSIVFVGFAVGNVISGFIGDGFGRRKSILLSYVIIGVAGVLTSLAVGQDDLLCYRFLVGVGCGIGFPAVYAMIAEVCPTEYRGSTSAVMIGFMALGELFAAVGVFVIDPNLDSSKGDGRTWRLLVQYSAAPAFVFLAMSACMLMESPLYLVSKGRIDDLNDVIATMAKYNGQPAPEPLLPSVKIDADDKEKEYSWWNSVVRLFGTAYMATTLSLCFLHFTKDFGVFGFNYLFPQYVATLAVNLSVGTSLMLVSCVAMPGVFLAAVISRSEYVGHINSLSLMASICGLACIGLLDMVPDGLSMLFACILKLLGFCYLILTIVYTAEVFPTDMRTTAVGICTAFGRVGSILAPIYTETALEYTGSFNVFWFTLMLLMLMSAIIAKCFFTRETKGRHLSNDDTPISGEKNEYGSTA